ncbi:hypothetical protein JCM3770_001737 [Rhodotorula araucariae]
MASTAASLHYDVVIVGTGIAALAAARELQPFRLLLVDARDRVGGRILTASVPLADPPAPESAPDSKAPALPTAQVDLGASMVHGFAEGNPVAGLITRELDMDVHVPAGAKGFVYGPDGPLAEADATSILAASAQNAFTPAPAMAADASVASLLLPKIQHDPRLVALARTAEIGAGIPLEEQAAQFAGFEAGYKGTDAYPLGGYGEVIRNLVAEVKAAGGEVRLSTEVTRIEDLGAEQGVRVTTRAGEAFAARAVISTIPHAVLQQAPPAFDPPLPPQFTAAIERMRTGALEKIVLSYPHAWWPSPDENGSFLLLPLSPEPVSSANSLEEVFARTVIPVASFQRLASAPHPTLLAYIGAAAARAIAAYPAVDVSSAFHTYLAARLAPASAPPAPRTALVTAWQADPYARGATSAPTPLSTSRDGARASPLDFVVVARAQWGGRLGFAGEHTDVENHGSVAGAFVSGRREGVRVRELLERVVGP